MEIIELLKRCYRVVLISRKPTDEELNKVAKVTATGIAALGLVGLVLSTILSLF